jgi:hypothetical protein
MAVNYEIGMSWREAVVADLTQDPERLPGWTEVEMAEWSPQ